MDYDDYADLMRQPNAGRGRHTYGDADFQNAQASYDGHGDDYYDWN